MYQVNKIWKTNNNSAQKKLSKEVFNQVVEAVEETITKFRLDSVKRKFDLNKIYIPNHACIWNKIDNIGKECRILEKNDKLILVGFIGETKINILTNVLSHLYRIEDIQLK